MQDLLFYLFSALTLGCAFLVVANPVSRDPVTSAMFLVLTLVSLSGLFVLLHAYFLAAIQVLVYAGAVVVLFLFVIMLLDPPATQRRRLRRFGLVAGGTVAAGLAGILGSALHRLPPAPTQPPAVEGATVPLGEALFRQYVLPFEMVSCLLLVAMVGVILLSRKDPA
ncbi:MAG TPA: NADH-quinone oxidoreductase subunit J [Verrucomicrobiota bacterium]|nr:NADH-quinone oxidoreductase subunit J [Verrucomicrobiota bacterium]HNU51831.1 NADH-quinone oxidoreductase subunit J [Verrucomicrobiota bacterium]